MTLPPDDRQPDEPVPGSSDVEPKLDEEAAWAAIVENYGERPAMFADAGSADEEPDTDEPTEPAEPAASGPKRSVFDRSFVDSQRLDTPGGELNTAADWNDEGHFVPPPPPPLPVVEPRRRLAWAGLFGAPLLMLLGVVLGWSLPDFLIGLLVTAFVGGFVYLVATMTRVRRDDWTGDDGAVV